MVCKIEVAATGRGARLQEEIEPRAGPIVPDDEWVDLVERKVLRPEVRARPGVVGRLIDGAARSRVDGDRVSRSVSGDGDIRARDQGQRIGRRISTHVALTADNNSAECLRRAAAASGPCRWRARTLRGEYLPPRP